MILEFNAPAKINLYLHIIERLDSGYHALDSLTVFCHEICDTITLIPADNLSLSITGDYAPALASALNNDNNLILKAISELAILYGYNDHFQITLNKALPIAAGIGGGSSDAAAVVKALVAYWNIDENDVLHDFLLSLGADVPACYRARALYMRGIGDKITEAPSLPPLYAILVNPNQACPTPPVFKELDLERISGSMSTANQDFTNAAELIKSLRTFNNDLQDSAIKAAPAIKDVLQEIERVADCKLARMSGSGATCFGLFTDINAAKIGFDKISKSHPDWWVRYGRLS